MTFGCTKAYVRNILSYDNKDKLDNMTRFEKKEAANMIITTTPNIENYCITEYLGMVSGAYIYIVGGLIGGGLLSQQSLYKDAIEKVSSYIESTAISKGADAVIGVQITTTTWESEVIVTGTGTAVKIQAAGWEDELPDI